MKTLLEMITIEMKEAFKAAGYDEELARVTLSNRPDLCEYQCNGAMAGAKKYKKAPIMIANAVVEELADSKYFASAEAVNPGFINLKLAPEVVAEYLNEMAADENLGVEKEKNPKKVIIDYGGPNVAKPLHVGHLRSAIIGESIKRIIRFKGNDVTGDIHLGDWGYQMGLIITELKERKPELPYFDESFEGEYPKEAPFTISELEEIYPTASGKAKEDDAYREKNEQGKILKQMQEENERLKREIKERDYKRKCIEKGIELQKNGESIREELHSLLSNLEETGREELDFTEDLDRS